MEKAPDVLHAAEVTGLVRRFLEGEPGLMTKPLRRGHAFLCRGHLGRDSGPPWLFAVSADGGVLVRLSGDARERATHNGVAIDNAALPEWVLEVTQELDAGGNTDADVHQVIGAPHEWVWIAIANGAAFDRRRPHIHEALEYCRHAKLRVRDTA